MKRWGPVTAGLIAMLPDDERKALYQSWVAAQPICGTAKVSRQSPVDRRLMLCDSYSRTRELCLAMFAEQNPAARVALFLEWGSCCDAPWAYRGYFARILREALKRVALAELLPADQRAFFDSLEPLINIYRGCESGRVRGLSWTTDIQVARGFAKGKRCINRHPTLVTADIPKEHVFAVFVDRKEAEVVVDPRRLRNVTTTRLLVPKE
jgi:hypothetical protein